MSKYQEALNDIYNNDLYDINLESIKTLQELVDKATPLKQIIKNGRLYCAECSYCILIEDIWEMSYCCACGQKIDWSDEE